MRNERFNNSFFFLRTIKKIDWTDDRRGISFLRIEIQSSGAERGGAWVRHKSSFLRPRRFFEAICRGKLG